MTFIVLGAASGTASAILTSWIYRVGLFDGGARRGESRL